MKTQCFILVALFTFISLCSFAQKADSISKKLTGRIIGKWQIQSTSRQGRDRSNGSQEQFIRFRIDAKYIWTSGKTVLDSGSYNTNEPNSEIYLQSARDKDHIQEWIINLTTNSAMTMTAKKGSRADETKYELVKVKDSR